MSLVNCNECGKQISDKAEMCPHCGNPIKIVERRPEKETVYIQSEKKSGCGIWAFVGVLIAIVLVIIILGSL